MPPIRGSYFVAGAALYVGVAGSTYFYLKNKQPPPDDAQQQTGSAFDRLAPVYDQRIGSEEKYMAYGLMRWWLLRSLKGDVLEISAGTGRNLGHYPLSSLTSLTLSDLSAQMLQHAEDKWDDELNGPYRHPELTVKFLVADAQHMVAAAGQPTRELPVHRALAPMALGTSGQAAAMGSGGGVCQEGQQQQQQQQQQKASVFSSLWRTNSRGSSGGGGAAAPGSGSSASGSPGDVDSTSGGGGGSGGSGGSSGSNGRSGGGSSGGCSGDGSGGGSGSGGSGNSSGGASASNAMTTGLPPHREQLCGDCCCSRGAGGPTAASSGAGPGAAPQRRPDAAALSTFSPQSFDFVVDTFGLCSHDHPSQVLSQAAQLLRPGGRLVLLEHGRSTWPWLNAHLDEAADRHHATWGCWWNRDIEGIVRQAGLEVVSCSRWHFGTSYIIVAQPPRQHGTVATSSTQPGEAGAVAPSHLGAALSASAAA